MNMLHRKIGDRISVETSRPKRARGRYPVQLLETFLVLMTLACSSESTFSGTTNWVVCDDDADCESYAGAYCSSEGYCMDAEGERIEGDSEGVGGGTGSGGTGIGDGGAGGTAEGGGPASGGALGGGGDAGSGGLATGGDGVGGDLNTGGTGPDQIEPRDLGTPCEVEADPCPPGLTPIDYELCGSASCETFCACHLPCEGTEDCPQGSSCATVFGIEDNVCALASPGP